jgi:hypothetical protein
MRRLSFIVLAVALIAPSLAQAQADDMGVPDIMKPEPWLPPKYHSPRGLPQKPKPLRPREAPPPPMAKTPRLLVVPQTGAVLPNLPATPGANGRESYQDRAVRCAHQAGVYGEMAGDRTGYINSCINQ